MVRATNADAWTCPGCHRTISRQKAESEQQWEDRRDRVQLEHGLVHEAEVKRPRRRRGGRR